MQKILTVVVFLMLGCMLQAQDSSKVRLNFAKTYFELGSTIYPSFSGQITDTKDRIVDFNNPVSFSPYLNIGGIHFWGKADFYISIPLGSFTNRSENATKTEISESVVTGMRVMPWALQNKQIRPYFGGSWIVSNFRQKIKDIDNPIFGKNGTRLEGGLVYGNESWLLRMGMNYYPRHNINYPVDATQLQRINTPAFSANLGFLYTFETTSKGMKAEVADELNGIAAFSKPDQIKSHRGDWFFGIGPSTSFVLSASEYNQKRHPYFNPSSISKTYVDLALGYHFNHARVVTALAYRRIPFKEKGYGVSQTTLKNSILLESYYYLLDYHGFTPYLGLNFGYDQVSVQENETKIIEKNQWTPGLTFGWDILPGKTDQAFVLRTNLRWMPFQKINIRGEAHALHQLEYNVIQAVWYPSRKKWYK